MKTAIGCDHTGFELKPAIIEHLKERRKTALDKGAFSHERADYPVYAKKVAGAVVS
ncbi:RpiB/LacA/LacB family sugar-phosphate isomerase [Sporolactobacillus terrae]|nr:RpiB/LacA/LacB family sugar-phosphate isomerase [Sporolactobacillus terrae]